MHEFREPITHQEQMKEYRQSDPCAESATNRNKERVSPRICAPSESRVHVCQQIELLASNSMLYGFTSTLRDQCQ